MILDNKPKFVLVMLIFLFAPLICFGQDLGSSTELLKTTKTKPAVKKKTVRSKKRSAAVPNKSSKKISSSKSGNTAGRSSPEIIQNQEIKPEKLVDIEPSRNVVILVGEPERGTREELYEKAIEAGNTGRDRRDYYSAEIAYNRAKTLKSNDSRAIYGLGNIYSDQGRWEEAERAYRTAIQLDPDSPESYVAISFVLTQPIAGTNLIERYAEAEKFSRRAIALDSENAVAFDQLGVSLELQGHITDETRSFYEKAVKLDPTFALAYAHLGRLYRKKGMVAESASAYVDAIQYSVDVPTMILVADVMQSQQRYLDSEQLLRRALKKDPKHPTALYLLGRALTTRGSYVEAETVLKKSAEVSPKSFVSYTLLGSLFLRRGKLETAESYLEQARKIVTQNEQKRLSFDFEAVGDSYLAVGRLRDAVRAYRGAISLDNKRAELVVKLNKAQPNLVVR